MPFWTSFAHCHKDGGCVGLVRHQDIYKVFRHAFQGIPSTVKIGHRNVIWHLKISCSYPEKEENIVKKVSWHITPWQTLLVDATLSEDKIISPQNSEGIPWAIKSNFFKVCPSEQHNSITNLDSERFEQWCFSYRGPFTTAWPFTIHSYFSFFQFPGHKVR